MDSIEKLKIFSMAADSLSFIAVANKLNLPRSTITYAIKSLEKEYEVRLFHRTTRQITLTNDGQLFLADVHHLLNGIQTLNRFKHPSHKAEGQISLGLPLRLATQVVIPHLAQFQQKYPNINICLSTKDGFSHLINEQLDCVLRVGGKADDYLIAKEIGQSPLLTLASKTYLTQYGHPQSLVDLEQHLAIGYGAVTTRSHYTLLHFAKQNSRMKSICTVADTESYLQCALHGLGIIQIPELDAKQYIESGELLPILPEITPLILPIQLIIANKKYRPSYCQDFLDWLEGLFKK